MDALVGESCEGVRALARLWQLRNKMRSVGAAASYGTCTAPAPHVCSTTACMYWKHEGLPPCSA
jgi:hypothetical protein